jgi:hypothetical protein
VIEQMVSEQAQRRTDRVHLKLQVEAAGKDSQGHEFVEQTNTVIVSGHGAMLVLKQEVADGQTLTLRRGASGDLRQEGQVRVVASLDGPEGSRAYCVAFVEPDFSLWDVHFPPKEQAQYSLGRILLECSLCHTRQVSYLNELELRSFESFRSIARHCQSCNAPTIWLHAPHEDPAQRPPSRFATKPQPESQVSASAADAASRKKRFKTILNGSIRQSGRDEEVVVCENLSPGGLCFRSRTPYAEGSKIEIAVPFAPGTANIFVPARIIYVQELRTAGLHRHGVAYLS